MAELMIAIVILGIGLLIVASMFPIAWTKARDQVEETNIANAATSAETMLRMKVRASRHDPELEKALSSDPNTVHQWFEVGRSTFLGDLGIFPPPPIRATDGTDTRVHPINAYNMLANPSGYAGAATGIADAPPVVNEVFVAEELHLLETNDPFAVLRDATTNKRRAPEPQVLFEDRLLPPLDRKLDPSTSALSGTDQVGILQQWFEKLRGRRYCWAALAKLDNGDEWGTHPARVGISYKNPDPSLPDGLNRPTWDDSRVFTMYCVTLRRAQATFRFPRQDFRNGGADWPLHPSGLEGNYGPVEPKALPAEFDTVFPTPWRVQIYVRNPVDQSDPNAIRGVPSEAEVNPTDAQTGPIVTGMLPVGAFMIDQDNGFVYKVARRKLVNNDQRAILTLDRELTQDDLTPFGLPYDENRDTLRTVWVFPPPVELDRSAGVVFAGSQPVVGIEVRPMVVAP